MSHYGVTHPAKSDSVKQKIRQTVRKCYGVDHISHLESIQKKISTTCRDRYGVDRPIQHPGIMDKMRRTLRKRYGVDNPMDLTKFRFPFMKKPEFAEILANPELLAEHYDGNCVTLADLFGVSPQTIRNRLSDFDIERFRNHLSALHQRFYELICSFGVTVRLNDRTLIEPLELDLHLPELKMAFEIDGVYWHTEERGKGPNYHIDKTLKCLEKEVQLYHIWDTDDIAEWEHIVEHLIQQTDFEHSHIYGGPDDFMIDARFPVPKNYKVIEYIKPLPWHTRDYKGLSPIKTKGCATIWDCGYYICTKD
jgi:hypothetical protein